MEVSTWLKDHLAETVEEAKLEDASEVVEYMKTLGSSSLLWSLATSRSQY